MARKSKATYVEHGYGQVEPNHLSAQRNAQIYAQLSAKADIDVLENGQFVKYDYANNEVNFTGAGEWMLVYNEVKIYDERETYKDYAMTKESQLNGILTPRVFKTNVGDIYTTNCVMAAGEDIDYKAGDKLQVTASNGILAKTEAGNPTGMVWQVAKVYTLADGQKAVKIMRIQ